MLRKLRLCSRAVQTAPSSSTLDFVKNVEWKDAPPVSAEVNDSSDFSFRRSTTVLLRGSVIPAAERADLAMESAGVNLGHQLRPQTKHPNVRIPALARAREIPFSLDHTSENENRMRWLWDRGVSHGVSWDELDSIFVEFYSEKERKELEWNNNQEQLWNDADRKVRDKLARKTSDPPKRLSEGVVRKARITLMTNWSKKNFKDFNSSNLVRILEDKVSESVLKRESAERARTVR